MTIDWQQPAENGQSILGYKVLLKQADGLFSESPLCVGTLYDVIVQTKCQVTVQSLQAAPYSLVQGASILAKVIAFNSIGNSVESPVGNGALLKLSLVPDSPILLLDSASTTKTQIGVTWTDGVYNGG